MINSLIAPLVRSKVSSYSLTEKTREFVPPGNLYNPLESTNFSFYAPIKEEIILYSTFTVNSLLLSLLLRWTKHPKGSPGLTGTEILLTSKLLTLLTPKTAGYDLKIKGFVS